MKSEGLQRMFNKNIRRQMMGGGFAALMLIGVSSMAGTSASMTIQNNTFSHTGTAVELLPPPPDANCRDDDHSARMYWTSLGDDYTYTIKWGRNDGKQGGTITVGAKPKGQEVYWHLGNWNLGRNYLSNFWAEIRAVNALGESSTRAYHREFRADGNAPSRYFCKSGGDYDPLGTNPADPPAGLMRGIGALEGLLARPSTEPSKTTDAAAPDETSGAPSTSALPSTSAPGASTSESPSTSAPGASTSESPSTSAPGASTSESPSTSAPGTTTPESTPMVKPKLTNKLPAPSDEVTAGKSTDGTSVLLVDGSGELLAGGEVESGATMQWDGDILWILGKDKVHRIMKSQDGTWKFYLDSGANLPAGLGRN